MTQAAIPDETIHTRWWWYLPYAVLIEGAVVLAFLAPMGYGLARLRDVLLLSFCLTTYTIVPVEGFGWLLLSVGIMQWDSHAPGLRLGYLGTFAVILFCREVPWIGWVPAG